MGHYRDSIDRREEQEEKEPEQRKERTIIVLEEVRVELERARRLHPKPQNSAHEGYAVILEELDEMWDEVKMRNSPERTRRMREEAVQVAAMCVRFIEDVCDK